MTGTQFDFCSLNDSHFRYIVWHFKLAELYSTPSMYLFETDRHESWSSLLSGQAMVGGAEGGDADEETALMVNRACASVRCT